MIRSKKSAGYSPKYGDGCPSLSGPDINVWKIVKKILPFLGTLPLLRISAGSIRTSASSGNAENELKAWSANVFRSAKKRMRGRRTGSPSERQSLRFQRL